MINRDEIDPQGAIIRQTTEAGVAISEELTDLNPNIEIDAKEFGEHVRNGGWRLGLLVARSVVKGVQGQRSDLINFDQVKISARSFALQAGNISYNTVKKYLDAWDMAAADGHVPASSTLSPGQAVDFTGTNDNDDLILTPQLWDSYYKPKGDENDKTVYDFFKGLSKYTDESVRTWLQAENFKGQSEFRPKQVYDFLESINRVSKTGMNLYLAMEDELGMEE
jgi:hypothetical protein